MMPANLNTYPCMNVKGILWKSPMPENYLFTMILVVTGLAGAIEEIDDTVCMMLCDTFWLLVVFCNLLAFKNADKLVRVAEEDEEDEEDEEEDVVLVFALSVLFDDVVVVVFGFIFSIVFGLIFEVELGVLFSVDKVELDLLDTETVLILMGLVNNTGLFWVIF